MIFRFILHSASLNEVFCKYYKLSFSSIKRTLWSYNAFTLNNDNKPEDDNICKLHVCGTYEVEIKMNNN